MRQRLRSLLRFSALVVLVRDDAGVGVDRRARRRRAARHRAWSTDELPQPLQRALTSMHPVLIADRLVDPDEDGFAALGRSGMYMALRARGRAGRTDRARRRRAERLRAASSATCIESLSSLLALSIDNARWFARLRTLGAEAERARIARELHDRVAQSLAYVAFELERMHVAARRQGRRDRRAARRRARHRPGAAPDDLPTARERERGRRHRRGRGRTTSSGSPTAPASRRIGCPSASPTLPYRIEQELWRIGQEALVNIERHCRCDRGHRALGSARRASPGSRSSTTAIGFEPDDVARRALRPGRHARACRRDRRAAHDRAGARAGHPGRRRGHVTSQMTQRR